MSEEIRSICTALLWVTSLVMIMSSCGDGGGFVAENRSNRGYNPGVGPFDSRGNYVERWADDPRKGRWWRKGTVSGNEAVASASPLTLPQAVRDISPRPSVQTAQINPNPTGPTPKIATAPARPKPVVKAQPKRKAPIRYTIKKGDTLWSISRKYKTTVSAIQRANGLRGTHLKIGRSLIIPRY